MSAHTRGPRRRSRKPRPGGAATATAERPAPTAPTAAAERPAASANARAATDRAARPRGASGRQASPQRTYGERPPAPWHPLPLSEALIFVGAIAFVVALARSSHGIEAAAPLLAAGLGALALGTAEVSWREHRSGFRSHTTMLAFVPVLALHTAVVFGYGALVASSSLVNYGMFAVDIAVFALLFRLLRARFLDARARRQGMRA